MSLINEPTQQRSLETQERILDAFEGLLKDKFLDDISVRQIAKKAGITPATIYRRFENKDALLPVLYTRYEQKLEKWAALIWTPQILEQKQSLFERLGHIVRAHIEFYEGNRAMIRTLYLKARTSKTDLESAGDEERKRIYGGMFEPIVELVPENDRSGLANKLPFLIFVMISTINEKMLFGDQKLANLTGTPEESFADQLTGSLTGILTPDNL